MGKHAAEILTAHMLAQAESIRKESETALLARVEQAELATEQAKAATKQAVDTAVAEKLADANRARKQSEAELLARAQQAESLKTDAEEALRLQRIANAQVVSEAKASSAVFPFAKACGFKVLFLAC